MDTMNCTKQNAKMSDVIKLLVGKTGYQNFLFGNIIKHLEQCEGEEDVKNHLEKAQKYAAEFIKNPGYRDSEFLYALIVGDFDEALSLWKKTKEKAIKLENLLNVLEGE